MGTPAKLTDEDLIHMQNVPYVNRTADQTLKSITCYLNKDHGFEIFTTTDDKFQQAIISIRSGQVLQDMKRNKLSMYSGHH